MQQRWLVNLILLGVIIVLGGVVFYTLEQEKEAAQLPKLTDLAAEQVHTIKIERQDEEPVQLVKDDQGNWQLTTPFTLAANHFRVEQLLNILSEQNYQLLEEDDLNLAAFKLDPALATLTLDQLKIAFGDQSPMGNRQRYIQIDQKIYLITDNIFYSIKGDAVSFVSLSLLGNKPKITELKVPDYHLTLQEQKWIVNTPLSSAEVDTSQDALNALIENWQNLQAFNVERYQESVSQGQIAVTLAEQSQPLVFEIISTENQFVLARPEVKVQYQLPSTQVDKLLHLPTKSVESTPASEE